MPPCAIETNTFPVVDKYVIPALLPFCDQLRTEANLRLTSSVLLRMFNRTFEQNASKVTISDGLVGDIQIEYALYGLVYLSLWNRSGDSRLLKMEKAIAAKNAAPS